MTVTPINRGLPEKLFSEIIKTNLECNYHKHLGIYVAELGYKHAVVESKVAECHINPRGIAHGAVAYGIIDTVMGMIMRTVNRNVVTIQSSMNHLKVINLGDELKAVARLLDYGKKIVLAEADLFNQDGDLVAAGRTTFYDKGVFLEECQDEIRMKELEQNGL